MKILMLSDTEGMGGAGIAASRLAHAFNERELDVTRVVLFPDTEVPVSWARKVFNVPGTQPIDWSNVPNRELESLVLDAFKTIVEQVKPDFINIHNLHGGLKYGWSVEMVGLCADIAPTLWTLHDMWSFTGKCAYSGNCTDFRTNCSDLCPDIDQYPFWKQQELTDIFERKREIVSMHPSLVAVTPSRWLMMLARQGCWGDKVYHIPNCLDLGIYSPQSVLDAKTVIGCADCSGPLILACAHDFHEKRKGGEILRDALEKLNKKVTVLMMGRNPIKVSSDKVNVIPLGYVTDWRLKVAAYVAADLFVHPAIEDNFPNTIAESLACSTPVVTFSSGGMTEMVQHGVNGFICTSTCGNALATTLESALENLGEKHKKSARKTAMELFDPLVCSENYINLFEQLRLSFD